MTSKQITAKQRSPRSGLVLAAAIGLVLSPLAMAVGPSFTANLGNTSTQEDTAKAINFSVTDPDTANNTLTVTGTSSDTSVVTSANVVVTSGAGGARTVTITPTLNQFGPTTITLTVSDGTSTATDTFVLTVNSVNDLPTITPISNPSPFNEDNSSPALSFTIDDVETPAGSLTLSRSSNNTTLVPNTAANIQFAGGGGSRTVTVDPAPNQPPGTNNATATITVTVTDADNGSANETFTVTVRPRPDPPAITGTIAAAVNDNALGNPFANIGIEEVDGENVTATVNLGNELVGLIVTVNAGDDSTTPQTLPWSSGPGSPATVQAALRALRYEPIPNRQPVGQSETVNLTLEVEDTTNRDASQNAILTVTSTNDSPNLAFTADDISDSQPSQPFRLTIADPDLGETFSATITETTSFGTLSSEGPFIGNAAEVQAAIRNVQFTPNPQNTSVDASFTVSVTDIVGPAVGATTMGSILAVNDPPSIVGVTTSLIRITDAPDPLALPTPFPTVRIDDPDLGQALNVTLSIDDPAKGTLSSNSLSGTAAAVTTAIRLVTFTPKADRLGVGLSENVTLTISVFDGTETRTNSQTVIRVTSINGPPGVEYTGDPVFPPDPVLIPPATPIEPFASVTITDDDPVPSVTVTIALDDQNKGGFDPAVLGGFQNLGGGTYEFLGAPAAATTALANLSYVVNPSFLFPANAPGGTDFSITVVDASLNRASRLLRILIQNEPKNYLVTETGDDPVLEGTLRHAVLNAGNNDTITFALPTYPARIRLENGPLVVEKNLTFAGPGADKLTISGDSNGNGRPDTQVFRVLAEVRIGGLEVKDGTAVTGGCIYVGPTAALTLHRCTIAKGVAELWGGGVDVDRGNLTVIGCLFTHNTTDPSLGFGGGAVSLYSNQECKFTNTTFSGNSQAAPNGSGGGAIYAENFNPQTAFDVSVLYCTFDENLDAADRGSSICSNAFGTTVELSNSIFADGNQRNLHVLGAGGIVSKGGNLSDDSTRTTFTQGGVPKSVILLSHMDPVTDALDDQTLVDPLVASLQTTTGPTKVHPLNPISTAIAGAAQSPTPLAVKIDQLGALRDITPDSGAHEFGSSARVVINEIHYDPAPGSSQFIEIYNPRDSLPVSLVNFTLWVDGVHRHTFPAGTAVIQPGFGLIVVDNPALINSQGTPEQTPSEAPNTLGLLGAGLIEIRSPGTLGVPIATARYNGDFAKDAHNDDFPNHSLTLAPQFMGQSYLPSGGVGAPPMTGFDPAGAGGCHLAGCGHGRDKLRRTQCASDRRR